MGATDFYEEYIGRESPNAAFDLLREKAAYELGHDGYTGSIAEKDDYIMIECPPRKEPGTYVDELMDAEDSRIDDKWGPAGCIEFKGTYLKKYKELRGLKGKKNIRAYIFFGCASS